MELETEDQDWAWCLVAKLSANGTGRGARAFAPGAQVYCFPPVLGGAYETVKVIGPSARSGDWVSAVVAARDLEEWKAQSVRDTQILAHIAPPWDASDTSRGVAEGIAQWKAGGPWPLTAVREWNRLNAAKHVGGGTLLTKLRTAIGRFLGR